MNQKEKHILIRKFIDIGIIQHGDFTLKSGIKSPVYFDLRKLYSHPKLLNEIVTLIHDKIVTNNSVTDLVCGIPSAGIPYATSYSLLYNLPMILLRKEEKEHGTKKRLEGIYLEGQSVLMIEDVITTGSSLIDGCQALKDVGLDVKMIVVIIDRRQNKSDICGCQIQSLLTMEDILGFYELPIDMINRKLTHPLAQKLWNIILEKRTNLCFSIDVPDDYTYFFTLINIVADKVCMIKIHPDIFTKYEFMNELRQLALKKNFLILDDRKYADIGSIVSRQFTCNKYKYGTIDSVTVHSIFGQTSINGLVEGGCDGCFLIAQSSAIDNLIDNKYIDNTISLANSNLGAVAGFISQTKVANDNFLYLTPGVHVSSNGDNLGQGYRTIDDAIIRDCCDVIIVGRGIYQSDNIAEEVKKYSKTGWNALLTRYNDT